MNFSEALAALIAGQRVLRYSSDIELKYITALTSHTLVDEGSGEPLTLVGGIYQVNFNNEALPFLPSTLDLMSEDWYIVKER